MRPPPRLALPQKRGLGLLAEHGLPLLIYAAISVGVTWPVVASFTTAIPADNEDARHHIWYVWHVREALLGRQPLFFSPLLYYPAGITLLGHGLGPVMGLLALPFWLGGPAAAYNGVVLSGFSLTGYCMYLLARSMVGQRGVALFAGLVPLTADMHLASLDARLEYAFLGLQAILLLVLQRALDPRRHAAWSLGVGAVLLLLLLQSGYQLVFGLLATGFLACTTLLTVRRAAAVETLRRVALIAIVSIGFVLPQVVNILVTTRSSGLVVDLRFFASLYDPDVLHYLLPAPQSIISDIFADSSLAHSAVWSKKLDVEKQVTLPLTVVALLIVLLRTRTTAAARWLGLFALCATLSLGTNITFADRRLLPDTLARFMPLSLLTGLPGLEFVRVSGRFMLLGYIVLGVCSALGLRWLTLAYPRRSNTLVALSIATLLLETWPWPWLVHPLPSVPAFYSALEGEETRYGLLDLPVTVRPDEGVVEHSSVYQLYQLVHRQGILFGYVSRVYEQHPVVPCDFWKADEPAPDLLVNGAPGDCRRRLGALLAEAGYRYVVWHKPDFAGYPAGSWPELRSRQTLDLVAGNRAPDYEDEQVRVFDLSQGVRRAAPDVSLDVAEHWYAIDQGGRWATSPARLRIYSDRPRRARLELRPSLLFSGEPPGKSPLGETGVLVIRAGDGAEQSLQLEVGREAAVELRLEPGYQTVELRLLAGGFVPADYGLSDRRVLSFAMSSLNLRTLD